MKKLNNHGLTAVEVLICFSITTVIVISLFKIINNFNEKQTIESRKNLIATYKNTVTKTIMDDILKYGAVNKVVTPPKINDKSEFYVSFEQKNNGITYHSEISIFYNDEHDNENDSDTEYIKYKRTNLRDNDSRTTFEETFPLSDIPGVEFNEPKIDYDEDNGLLRIYVGIIDLDLNLGDKYEVLDITIPLTDTWKFLE